MKEPIITVSTVFAGTQSAREAFVSLIRQRRAAASSSPPVDVECLTGYTKVTPRSGVHSETENVNENERSVC